MRSSIEWMRDNGFLKTAYANGVDNVYVRADVDSEQAKAYFDDDPKNTYFSTEEINNMISKGNEQEDEENKLNWLKTTAWDQLSGNLILTGLGSTVKAYGYRGIRHYLKRTLSSGAEGWVVGNVGLDETVIKDPKGGDWYKIKNEDLKDSDIGGYTDSQLDFLAKINNPSKKKSYEELISQLVEKNGLDSTYKFIHNLVQNKQFSPHIVIPSYDTGGYTGSWGPEGRLAMLHQKEIVLNAHDTENFLTAIEIVRSIATQLENNALRTSQGLGSLVAAAAVNNNREVLEQNVTIHAEFPNATDHNEIELAFNDLINQASQYVNRR